MGVNPILLTAAFIGIVIGYLLGKPRFATRQEQWFRGLFIYLTLTALFVAAMRFKLLPLPHRVIDVISSIIFVTQLLVLNSLVAGRLAPPYWPLRWCSFAKATSLFVCNAALAFYLLKLLVAWSDG